jgi:type I site-specific restriction-modification system R (restriction) subunit
MRDALPNASFIGFTGTPIALEDRDTRGVFGDYVSIYDIQDAVDDKATVPRSRTPVGYNAIAALLKRDVPPTAIADDGVEGRLNRHRVHRQQKR